MPIISGGGGAAGFSVGSSYITCSYADLTGKVSGSTAVPSFTKVAGAGSDLSVHAADHTLIDVATAGWYLLTIYTVILPDTANLLNAQALWLVNGASPRSVDFEIGPLNTAAVLQDISLPDIDFYKLNANDQLSFNIVASTSAGTWSNFGLGANAAMKILRLG